MLVKNNTSSFFMVIFYLFGQLSLADVIVGNGNTEIITAPTTKDINCQNYIIREGGLLDISNGGILREVTKLEINGEFDYGSGEVKELGAWVNNGTVLATPTQVGDTANLQFTTMCGPISVLGISDTDGDGISDADEGDNAVALGHGITLDQDNDGIYNFLDTDSDNDGLNDADEGNNSVDSDNDGIPDYLDDIDSVSGISLTKIGTFNDENSNGYADIGETISYEFNVTNTGDTTLLDINISDDNAKMGGDIISVLLAKQSDNTSFTAVHTLTYEDIVDDKVSNQATVSAEDELSNSISATSDDPTNPVGSNDVTVTRFSIEPAVANDDSISSQLSGNSVEIDTISNDISGFFDLNASSVRIIDPDTGEKITQFVVAGEGKWTVDTNTGKITFVPEDEYIGDPNPIEYSIEDVLGTEARASVAVDYAPEAVNDDITDAKPDSIVLIQVLNNDKRTSQSFDFTTLVITDAEGTVIGTNNNGKEFAIYNEGVWIVHDNGTISFEADDGFDGDVTPIYYKIQDTNADFTNVAKITVMYRDATVAPTPTPTITPTPTPTPDTDAPQVILDDITTIDVLKNKEECQGEDVTLVVLENEGQNHGNAYVNDDKTKIIYQVYTNEPASNDYFVYMIEGGACDEERTRVNVSIKGNDDGSSNNGTTHNAYSLILLMFATLGFGLFFVMKENDENNKERNV
jgi:CshA-type fibril repeat protein